MDSLKELTECLALQAEIDAKTLELRKRFKEVIKAEEERGNNGPIVVKIGGESYRLEREDAHSRTYRETMKTAHQLGGFYTYRLFKLGKVIE